MTSKSFVVCRLLGGTGRSLQVHAAKQRPVLLRPLLRHTAPLELRLEQSDAAVGWQPSAAIRVV